MTTEPINICQYDPECFRHAAKEDRLRFMDLAEDFLIEAHAAGGDIIPSFKSMNSFGRLFDAYVGGELAGVCTLFDPGQGAQGFWLCGESFGEDMFDYGFGKLANFWGIYIDPDFRGRGVAHPLQFIGHHAMQAFNFDIIQGDIRANNAAGEGQAKHMGGELVSYVMRVRMGSFDEWTEVHATGGS